MKWVLLVSCFTFMGCGASRPVDERAEVLWSERVSFTWTAQYVMRGGTDPTTRAEDVRTLVEFDVLRADAGLLVVRVTALSVRRGDDSEDLLVPCALLVNTRDRSRPIHCVDDSATLDPDLEVRLEVLRLGREEIFQSAAVTEGLAAAIPADAAVGALHVVEAAAGRVTLAEVARLEPGEYDWVYEARVEAEDVTLSSTFDVLSSTTARGVVARGAWRVESETPPPELRPRRHTGLVELHAELVPEAPTGVVVDFTSVVAWEAVASVEADSDSETSH